MAAYESPDTPWGGVAAVLRRLPSAWIAIAGAPVFILTPYHHRILRPAPPPLEPIGRVSVPFGGRRIVTRILRRSAPADAVQWIFLAPEATELFAGGVHPYDVDASTLRRDALFFGAAVTRALSVLPARLWTAFLHDWQAATVSFFRAKAGDHRVDRAFIQLHSSFDSGPLTDADLARAGADPRRCKGPAGHADATVLQRALTADVVAPTVLTVSRQFAVDLVEDPLQTNVMADHLQPLLRGRLVAATNGPFVVRTIPDVVLDAASRGDSTPVLAWKEARRSEFLSLLRKDEGRVPSAIWGDLYRFDPDRPWLLMAGRHDRQKGYDLAVAAAREALGRGTAASFVFLTLPGPDGLPGLRFLEKLASDFPERVLALPYRLQAGYGSVVSGSTWGLMPSRFEPFGMANEFMTSGTPCVARATGGLLEQVVPYRAAAAFSSAVAHRSDRWHSTCADPTGILFREPDATNGAAEWRTLSSMPFGSSHHSMRESMVDELRLAIEDAVRLFQDEPRRYARMISAGVEHVERAFSWRNAAAELWRHAREMR